MKNNYYEILEVSQSATQHDIAVAYEKAKRLYSSQNVALSSIFSDEEANTFRTMIEEAFAILGNQTYRNLYEKRIQSKHYTEKDLTIESIKAASLNLFPELKKPSAEKIADYLIDETLEKDFSTKKEWLGEDLKKFREYKNISIETMHDKTKINTWYLTAIEKMDVVNLPAAVFVRGYVIQIARVLGLKDMVVADSYMKIFRKKIEN